jgi:hypothetical protein
VAWWVRTPAKERGNRRRSAAISFPVLVIPARLRKPANSQLGDRRCEKPEEMLGAEERKKQQGGEKRSRRG